MTEVIGVTGSDDPQNEAPWAMPIAFLVDRAAPASTTAICEATAMAVVALLSDPRSLSGEWRAPVERWESGRIRKVVRRGRRPQFDKASVYPGVTVEHAGATVRAFVPGPTDALPPEVRRLQVSGSEPPEQGTPSEGGFLTVMVNPSLEMSTGKTAAQAGHAAQLAWMRMDEPTRERWRSLGLSVRVVRPSAREWEALSRSAPVRVVDAGFTEIPPGSNTVVATW